MYRTFIEHSNSIHPDCGLLQHVCDRAWSPWSFISISQRFWKRFIYSCLTTKQKKSKKIEVNVRHFYLINSCVVNLMNKVPSSTSQYIAKNINVAKLMFCIVWYQVIKLTLVKIGRWMKKTGKALQIRTRCVSWRLQPKSQTMWTASSSILQWN